MEFNKMSLLSIKEYVYSLSIEEYSQVIAILEKDSRKTIQNYSNTLQKKFQNYHKELLRIEKMKSFEKEAFDKGYSLIAGIDEVGRGPLAGPVVSAAVILPRDFNILYINDSKKLSAQKREELYIKIKENAIDIGIGIVNAQTIDEINIYQSTKLSMAIAVENLQHKPDLLLIDAMNCDNIPITQVSIIKGDCKSISIAAASIVAKVIRDKMMDEYHKEYPQYAFEKNKGYGTEIHRNAILEFGTLSLHRKSFLKNIIGS